MKTGRTVVGILVGLIFVSSAVFVTLQQQTSAFGFVERQQIGDFQKLTGESVQNVINSQRSSNSEGVEQFRILTAQFENDILNAVSNDHSSLISGKVTR